MWENYAEKTYNPNARLVILKALAQQTDYRMNDSLLLSELEAFAFNKGKDFLRTQLQWLADQAGAVTVMPMGTSLIAELTESGLDHVERRQIIPGITRPSPIAG